MNNELLANSITKALAYAENGGKPNLSKTVSGKTGEMKSIFQFTPKTWKLYAKQILGDENAPLNNDNETYVVNEKVKDWIKKGHTAREIASMWNAGESKPDAYKQGWKGVNQKYGVSYDTPSYANKVLKYSKQFYQENNNNQMQSKPQENNSQGGNQLDAKRPLDSIISMIKQASSPNKSVSIKPKPNQGSLQGLTTSNQA